MNPLPLPPQKREAKYEGGWPSFPRDVQRLNLILREVYMTHWTDFILSACRGLRGYTDLIYQPITSDKYRWWGKVVFSCGIVRRGEVLIFIPYQVQVNDTQWVNLVRSVAVYATGHAQEQDALRVTARFTDALYSVVNQ